MNIILGFTKRSSSSCDLKDRQNTEKDCDVKVRQPITLLDEDLSATGKLSFQFPHSSKIPCEKSDESIKYIFVRKFTTRSSLANRIKSARKER